MRRHGWELPYHPLQVVAIAVFLALAFAFYVFFAPFIGTKMMQLIGISFYSPLVASVFGLYIWCAATNPSDPRVLVSKKYLGSTASMRTSPSLMFSWAKNDSSTEPSMVTRQSSLHSVAEAVDSTYTQNGFVTACLCGLSICVPRPKQPCAEDMLYCSLCEVEISKHSKHCRVCDKCVDSFDHHCRWINNCIGRKNYRIFIALVVTGLCMLVLQWSVGVWVIARCFLNRTQLEEDITSKLGSSFTVIPFLIVVGTFTVISAFATMPLAQLCLFHALLIQKGISTYDYIVAMREQDQQFGVSESVQSPCLSSPSPEATTVTANSSMRTGHHSPWCTPPHSRDQGARSLDRFDIESMKKAYTNDAVFRKQSTKISAWALARLNPEDALRASAEARKRSSVLRPIIRKVEAATVVIPETDISGEYSSGEVVKDFILPFPPRIETRSRPDNMLQSSKLKTARSLSSHSDAKPALLHSDTKTSLPSGRSSVDEAKKLSADCSSGSAKMAVCLTPLQLEARNAFCRNDQNLDGSSSSSLTTPNGGSPSAHISCDGGSPSVQVSCSSSHGSNRSISVPPHQDVCKNPDSSAGMPAATSLRSSSDEYEASGGESADDSYQNPDYHIRSFRNFISLERSFGVRKMQCSPSTMTNH